MHACPGWMWRPKSGQQSTCALWSWVKSYACRGGECVGRQVQERGRRPGDRGRDRSGGRWVNKQHVYGLLAAAGIASVMGQCQSPYGFLQECHHAASTGSRKH